MFSIIGVQESDKWDQTVSTFPTADVFYLNGYVKACQLRGEGEPFLFYYDNGSTRAINVVMKRDIADADHLRGAIPEKTYYDLSSPYGYAGFIFQGEDHKSVYAAYDKYCLEEGFVSDFVRFNLFSGAERLYSGTVVHRNSNVVRTLEKPLNEIENEFDRKVRKNLRKARSFGLQVEIDTKGGRLDDFLKIYYDTMDRANANKSYYFPKDYFLALNKMVGNFVYFHVVCNGKVISTELVLYCGDTCYSFLGGTDAHYFEMRPNDLLKVAVIEWAKEVGLKRYVLGGGYKGDDGIFRFKKSFAPTCVVPFFTGHRIFRADRYSELVTLRREQLGLGDDQGFFPEYRR
jgi:hypothetical protein